MSPRAMLRLALAGLVASLVVAAGGLWLFESMDGKKDQFPMTFGGPLFHEFDDPKSSPNTGPGVAKGTRSTVQVPAGIGYLVVALHGSSPGQQIWYQGVEISGPSWPRAYELVVHGGQWSHSGPPPDDWERRLDGNTWLVIEDPAPGRYEFVGTDGVHPSNGMVRVGVVTYGDDLGPRHFGPAIPYRAADGTFSIRDFSEDYREWEAIHHWQDVGEISMYAGLGMAFLMALALAVIYRRQRKAMRGSL